MDQDNRTYQRPGRLATWALRAGIVTAAVTGGITCRNAVHDKIGDINSQRYHDGVPLISDTTQKVADAGAMVGGVMATGAGIGIGSAVGFGALLAIKRRKWEKEQARKANQPDNPEPPLAR